MKILIPILLLLAGCAAEPKPLKAEVALKAEVEFNLVPSSSYMPCVSNAVGCATVDNRIWVIGKEQDGKILFDRAVMGHEVMHLLHWMDKRVTDPDLVP